MSAEIKSKIARIFDQCARFREDSLESKFSIEEKAFIDLYTGPTFKIRFLRAAGLGQCSTPECANSTEYKEKLRFSAHCTSCAQSDQGRRVQSARDLKLSLLVSDLALRSLVLVNAAEYKNVSSKMKFKCTSCNTVLKTTVLRHAVQHKCGVQKALQAVKINVATVQKPKATKLNICTEPGCGKTRNIKSKLGRCARCAAAQRKRLSVLTAQEILAEFNYTALDGDFLNLKSTVKVKNLTCSHEFSAVLKNIISGQCKCTVCEEQDRNSFQFNKTKLFISPEKRTIFGALGLPQNFMIVFQDELLDHRRRIIESMLNHAEGHSERIYARSCEIKEIDGASAARFMYTNHLSGNIAASIRLGLMQDGVLVSLMLFSKSRFDRDHQYEIIRYANKLDTVVVGGITRLYKEFLRQYTPESVMTYADKRFGSGGAGYLQLGMKLSRSTPPSTWWVKDGRRVNSQDTRVTKISKLIDYNPALPIDVNMEQAGWVRIDDLGSNVYSHKICGPEGT
jgi:hypothetical protein